MDALKRWAGLQPSWNLVQMGTSNLSSWGLSGLVGDFLIFEMVFYLTKNQQGQELKRSLSVLAYRLSFAAFIPAKELKRFNQFLQKGAMDNTRAPIDRKKKRQGN